MRVSVERMRVWLLAGAGLLLLVIAAFLGYAHLRAHRFLKDLPGRLGVDITRESDGFTYSQSSRGRTIYTIHAAKLVQRRDGKTTLHDVGIVLYGQRQDRVDRIYGSEFEYDQKAGVIRAMGEVHLDLQAPAPTDARGRAEYAAGRDPGHTHGVAGTGADGARGRVGDGEKDDRMVHVKTSGLVFVESLGVASTDQEIEFEYDGMNGRAKGADYNSDTGVTVLQADVRVSGLRDGQPVLLTAAHAVMDRGKQQMTMERARYVSVGENGAGRDGGRTMTAAAAAIQLRSDGSVERVQGSRGVSLEQGGGVLRGQSAEVEVSAGSRPETARIFGGVTYAEDGGLRQMQGRAGQGTVRFDKGGRVDGAVMTGAAEMHIRERAGAAAMWNERTVSGETIETRFATAEGNRRWMREAVVSGGGRMLLVDRVAGGGKAVDLPKGAQGRETTSELRGDRLTAEMAWDGGAGRLTRVTGAGHTALRRRDAAGVEDTSEGEVLEVSFGAGAARAEGRAGAVGGRPGAGGAGAGQSISSAVQSGGVRLSHIPAVRATSSGAGASDGGLVRGSAARASYEGDGQTLTLSGGAELTQADSLLRAQTVTMRRDTGDATAVGSVKASYRQAGSAEPVHVLAARAELKHEAGRATFFGNGAGAMARLWQGGSQVEAAVIEFNQGERTLVARSGGAGDVVHTVLVGGGAGGGAEGGRKGPQVARVTSRSLNYADADRTARFSGGVVLQGADGTVRGERVTAVLRAAGVGSSGAGGAEPGAGFPSGSVDRVTAEGGVEVSEAGRRATGERLVYTAASGTFVMTGTAAAAPKVVDEVQGTTTGAALEFHAGDNTVMVLGDAGAEGRRVRTETRVRQR